jgi:hypothetical protein
MLAVVVEQGILVRQMVEMVVLVVAVTGQDIQHKEQQELTTLAEVVVEVLILQQELLVVPVSSSLLTQPLDA